VRGKYAILDDEEGWVEITDNEETRPFKNWNPKEGDEIRGFYIGFREFETKEGKTFGKHLIESEDCIWRLNDNTVISNALKDVQEGTPIKIKYLGMQTGKRGWEYKNFSVAIKKID